VEVTTQFIGMASGTCRATSTLHDPHPPYDVFPVSMCACVHAYRVILWLRCRCVPPMTPTRPPVVTVVRLGDAAHDAQRVHVLLRYVHQPHLPVHVRVCHVPAGCVPGLCGTNRARGVGVSGWVATRKVLCSAGGVDGQPHETCVLQSCKSRVYVLACARGGSGAHAYMRVLLLGMVRGAQEEGASSRL
jgi:hypothetical protein